MLAGRAPARRRPPAGIEQARPRPPAADAPSGDLGARIHLGVLAILQAIMALELLVLLLDGQWLNAFLVLSIMAVTLAPVVLRNRFFLNIPPEFQASAVLFVFAALFLGEIQSYYDLIWWWDIALHGVSGLLLGILGFLLVYVLNEHEPVDLRMRSGFVAFFSFLFAVAVGTLWELFEFVVDLALGTRMQKPMFADPSGLTDTMWDLIVNLLGALVVSLAGYKFLMRGEPALLETWVRRSRRYRKRVAGAD